MFTNIRDLDEKIYQIMQDFATVRPPLASTEIAQRLLDRLGPEIRKAVYATLERMAAEGAVVPERDAEIRRFRLSSTLLDPQ